MIENENFGFHFHFRLLILLCKKNMKGAISGINLFIFIIVCVEYVCICYARHYPKCHLIEMEKCFDKLHQLKDPQHDPSFLLTSGDGLDKICR